jgi:glycosyltransferase involved in cell wall biosynthesis
VCAVTSVHQVFDTRIFQKQCKSLVRAGFDVTLIAPHDRNEVVDGIRIVAMPRVRPRLQRATFATVAALRIASEVNASVYHLHDPELIPAGLMLKARGSIVIFDAHEDYAKAMLSKYYLPRWSRSAVAWGAGRLTRLAYASFSAFVSATPGIAKTLGGITDRHIIVQNFPDQNEFSSCDMHADGTWAQRSCSVAYVGGVSEIRGLFPILNALTHISAESPIRLAIAGSFAPESLRKRVEQHPGWKRVEWLGQLPRAELAVLLGKVRAGLVLFKNEPNHVTAYPTKMFEYMSAGIPVIVSDFPLWRRIVEEAKCGLAVDPMDSHAIARAIEYVVSHEAEADLMGRAGREAVKQRYNWALEEAKLVRLYRHLTDDSRSRIS